MNKFASILLGLVIFLAASPQSLAADLNGLVSSLKGGGYVLVIRHGATDDSQKDVYPFKLDDMTAQRQLSEKGRSMARELGAALKKLGVPIGEVYTSQLNRVVETGKLIGGKDVSPVDVLTDSSAGILMLFHSAKLSKSSRLAYTLRSTLWRQRPSSKRRPPHCAI